MLVFVYGTLKEGYGNNRILQQGDAEFVAYDRVKGYQLYNSGFPVAAVSDDGIITGEIWDIHDNEDTLQNLDWLEGEGSMYHRTVVETESGYSVSMYVGHDDYWGFEDMRHCPFEFEGDALVYTWSRW